MYNKPKNKKLYQESQGTESETNKNFFRNNTRNTHTATS